MRRGWTRGVTAEFLPLRENAHVSIVESQSQSAPSVFATSAQFGGVSRLTATKSCHDDQRRPRAGDVGDEHRARGAEVARETEHRTDDGAAQSRGWHHCRTARSNHRGRARCRGGFIGECPGPEQFLRASWIEPESIGGVDHHARACWWSTSEETENGPRRTRGMTIVPSTFAKKTDLFVICSMFDVTLILRRRCPLPSDSSYEFGPTSAPRWRVSPPLRRRRCGVLRRASSATPTS
jgi:hypothetical protein